MRTFNPVGKKFVFAIAALLICACSPAAERAVLSLDGRWDIADGTSAAEIPARFTHTVQVPGLAHLASPPFPDVDRFLSREHLAKLVSEGKAPTDWMTNYWTGKVEQARNYFWYQTRFRAPAARTVAILKINKAQFGAAAWLNGQKLGESAACFSAISLDLSKAIHWNADNTLVIRIGAHPAVLPDDFPTGSDFEKIKWTPGIYDQVSVYFCDSPVFESVQVAPRIATQQIVVELKLKNYSEAPCSSSLTWQIKPWQNAGRKPLTTQSQPITLQPGEEKVFRRSLPVPGARLWSPEDPYLYVLETSTRGDSVQTRFGMREFRFDSATKSAWLNGKVYYLRGSNITLHRFFEDPSCGDLPWEDSWVRRLLGELPKKMHWNYFRFCIGPVPERWFDICDETGLLIQNEFPVWTGGKGWYKEQGYSREYNADEMLRQYQDWMRDNWNHPSVAVWDANNETRNDLFGQKLIPALRGLDLSGRSWENSYNPPAGPNDMVEYHPYFEHSGYRGKLTFKMTDLEAMDGKPPKGSLPSDTNPPVINEYGWLWLNRDGTPTELTRNVYAQLLGTNATPRLRLDLWAYLLAGETEFWRAHRQFAGIVHFVYLTCSYPGVYTSDHFSDVTRLKLDPAFADYMGEAFKPLGVYLNFFHPTLQAGASHEFVVKMVNDYAKPVRGSLILTLENRTGHVLAKAVHPFAMPELGACDVPIALRVPNASQDGLLLKATSLPERQLGIGPTCSRRWVSLVP